MTRVATTPAFRPAALTSPPADERAQVSAAADVFERCGPLASKARDVFAAITEGAIGRAAMLEGMRAACRFFETSPLRAVFPLELHVAGLREAVSRASGAAHGTEPQEVFAAAVRAASAATDRAPAAGQPFARIGALELETLGVTARRATFWPFMARELAGPLTNPEGRVQRVLYTGGAHDVAAAFSFFEGPRGGPRDIVIVDVQGFGAPDQIVATWRDPEQADVFCSANAREGFTCTDDGWGSLRSVGCIGPAALWQLEQLGARDVSITYRDAHGRELDPSGVRHVEFVRTHHLTTPIDLDRSVAVVELRATIEGQARRVSWVRADANDVDRYPERLRRELEEGFDAAIMKGAYFKLSEAASARLGASLRGEGLVVGDSSVSMLGARVRRELPVLQRWGESLRIATLRELR